MAHVVQSSEITETIIKTVADYENVPPDDLPPLADKVDVETYHKLTASDGQLDEPLEFEYLWYQVTVQPDCEVSVTP